MYRDRKKPVKHQYPYVIPLPPVPSDADLASTNQSRIVEFFRIEAVLRGEIAQSLYKQSDGEEFLLEHYFFNWSVLDGKHHPLLNSASGKITADSDGKRWTGPGPSYPMMPVVFGANEGVTNLVKQLRGINRPRIHDGTQMDDRLDELRADLKSLAMHKETASRIYVCIDTAYPWKGIQRYLHELYVEHRAETGMLEIPRRLSTMLMGENFYQIPAIPVHAPLIRSAKTWLQYLQCYDLRHCEGLSFGEVAQRVYSLPQGRSAKNKPKKQQAYDEAEKAYKRITRLIKAAESNLWPPISF